MSQKLPPDFHVPVSPADSSNNNLSATARMLRIDSVATLALEGIRQQADLKGVPMRRVISDVLKYTMNNLGVRLS